ncbi:MAG: DMT family transporter [Alphaproteobacteria bacterium]
MFTASIMGNASLMPFLNVLRWFLAPGYAQGVFWFIMIGVVSLSNDVIMRFLGYRLPVLEVAFFRFLFSMVSLIPFLLWRGRHYFYTKNPKLHVLRAVLGIGALGAWAYSVSLMPLSENTVIMSAEPLFFMPFAVLFLKERVDRARWLATSIGFIGILVIVQPGTMAFRAVALIPVASAVLFALLDIVAKKMVSKEHTITMLFYFSLGTTLAGLIPLPFIVWETPQLGELGLLFLLGIGANLIQVCLFCAFSATEASALMPFRYVEFIFSALLGFLLFHEIPTLTTLLGTGLIIVGTFYISYVETRKEMARG